jgi:negative regulator of sigma E activity
MSQDLESELREALRPIAPSATFEKKLIACVTEDPQHSQPKANRVGGSGWHSRTRWLSVAAAACLLIAVGLQNRMQLRRERDNGQEARRQVVEALRVTSQKLDLAYEIVKSQSSSFTDDNPGA